MSEEQSSVTYRDIPGWPGYKAGSDGSIWSCRTFGPARGERSIKPRKLASWRKLKQQKMNKCGHLGVRLYPAGTFIQVHRLILFAFVGPCQKGMECCHFDGNPRNNNLPNLRWDTNKANKADMKRHGRGRWVKRSRNYAIA